MPGRTTNRIAHLLGGAATRRRRHRRVALAAGLLAVVAVVLVIAGSGDDGDDDEVTAPSTTTSTTGTSLPSTGNPVLDVCRANDVELAIAQNALLGNNEAPGAVEGFLGDAFVDLMRDRSAALRALEPPPSDEVASILDDFDAVVDAVEADPSIGVGADPFIAVNERWRAAGLDGCVIASTTVDS